MGQMMKHIARYIFPVLAVGLMLSWPGALRAENLGLAFPKAPDTLDPHRCLDPWAGTFIFACYQRLVEYQGATDDLAPSAAVTWRISDDRTIYTFVLKKGLTFSDGRPLDAAAVSTSFSRAYRVGDRFSKYFPYLKAIELIGPYTFRFKLARPDPSFLHALASVPASIVSPTASLHPPDYLDHRTLGSGLYQMEGADPGSGWTIAARQDLGSSPAVKSFQVVFEPRPEKRLDLLKQGRVQVAADIGELPPEKGGVTVKSINGPAVGYLAFNTSRPWMDRIEARQALVSAMDIKGLLREMLPEKRSREAGFLPAGMRGDLSEAARPAFDPVKAASLMDEIGLPPSPLVLAFSADIDFGLKSAHYIKDNLAALGVETVIEPIRPGLEETAPGAEYDLFFGYWRPFVSVPERYFDHFVGKWPNRCRYRNEEVAALLEQASASADSDQRLTRLYEIQRILARETPYVLLFGGALSYGLAKNVQGFRVHPAMPETVLLTGLKAPVSAD